MKDNRIIKAGMMTGDFVQNVSNGQLAVPSDMYKFFFEIVYEIAKKGGVELTKPGSYNLPKTK